MHLAPSRFCLLGAPRQPSGADRAGTASPLDGEETEPGKGRKERVLPQGLRPYCHWAYFGVYLQNLRERLRRRVWRLTSLMSPSVPGTERELTPRDTELRRLVLVDSCGGRILAFSIPSMALA